MRTLDFKGGLFLMAAAICHFGLHQRGPTILFLSVAILYWTARDLIGAWKEPT